MVTLIATIIRYRSPRRRLYPAILPRGLLRCFRHGRCAMTFQSVVRKYLLRSRVTNTRRVFASSEPTLSSLGRIHPTAKTAKAVCQRISRALPVSLGFGRIIPTLRLVYLQNVSETPSVSSRRSKCGFKR